MKEILRSSLWVFISLFAWGSSQANEGGSVRVQGRIIDQANGKALPYAAVMLKGSTKGAVADFNGRFQLDGVKPGTIVLVASFAGYQNKEFEFTAEELNQELQLGLNEVYMNLEEVVITGTRTYKTLKEVPVITRVISEKEIKQNDVVNFKDLLELELPGLEFSRMGGNASINLQGLGSKYILFLVDGERMTGETRDNIDYNRINLDNIERIEVVKGASSTLYGSNAVGAVVNIITKKPKEPFHLNLSSRVGGIGEYNSSVNVGSKWRKWSVNTSAAYRHAQSYQLQSTSFLERHLEDGTLITDSVLYTTFVDGSLSRIVDQMVQYRPFEGFTADVKLGYFDNMRFNSGKEGEKRRDFYQDYNATARLKYQISQKHFVESSWHYDNYSKHDYFVKLLERKSNYQSLLHNPKILYNWKPSQKHDLAFGLEYLDEALQTYMFADNKYYNTSSYVVFAQEDYNFNTQLSLTGGLRFDYHSSFGEQLTPKISLMYKTGPVNFRTGYAAGYRAPTVKELYTDWDHRGMFRIIGNPDLVPETSHNFNGSAEYLHEKVNASFIGYYNEVNNKILNVWNLKQDTAFHKNVEKASVYGLDVNLNWRINPDFWLRTAYAYVKEMAEENGRNISYTRPHSLVLRGEYRFHVKSVPGSLGVGVRALSGVSVSNFNTTANQYAKIDYPGYQLWKVNLSAQLPLGIKLTATCDNIFDYKASVVTSNSSISPGRLFYAGLSWDVDRLFARIF